MLVEDGEEGGRVTGSLTAENIPNISGLQSLMREMEHRSPVRKVGQSILAQLIHLLLACIDLPIVVQQNVVPC